jgi:hypothetical protein
MDLSRTWQRRAGAAFLILGLGAAAATVVLAQRPLVPRVSEAEKVYVAVSATEKRAEGPRTATIDAGYGRKFAAENTRPRVTISNHYLDLAVALFDSKVKLQCTGDGGLVVAGRAGFDTDGRPLGTGFWRVAPDGAVTPMMTRSTNAYGLTSLTTCNAPFGKSRSRVGPFTLAADGRILVSGAASVQAVTAEGFVARVAGSPRDCENDNTKGISGFGDGDGGGGLFNEPDRPVEDPDGNLWVPDQKGCALRKVTPKGEVSTVLGPDVLCSDTVPGEDRPLLNNLQWDAANGGLVAGGSRTVALPLHDLYTLVWRIAPDGTYRRVLFGKKVTRVSPSKHHLDGVSAMAVDPKGRIFIISRLMLFERRGWDELQLLRVDEAGNTVVEVSGAKIPRGTWTADHPLDGPVEQAVFNYSHDMCFSPDGTLFVSDDIFVRRLDTKGQVTTWLF